MFFQKIVVPVDGSRHSIKAAQYARGIARTQGSKIVLLHCYGHIPNLIGGSAREKLIKELEAEGKNLLEPFREIFKGANVEVVEAVLGGNPGDAICKTVDTEKADLVIIGSRGLSDLEGFVLGSVSHTVIHRACCPVLIIR